MDKDNKIRITLRISYSVYEHLRTKKSYQRLIDEILIKYVERETQNYGVYKLLSMFDKEYQKLEYFKETALKYLNEANNNQEFENLIKEFDSYLSNLFDHEYYYLNAFKEHSIDGQDEILASTLALIGLYRDGFILHDEGYALSDLSKKEYSIAIVKMMIFNLVFLGDLSSHASSKQKDMFCKDLIVRYMFEIALQNRFPIEIIDDSIIKFASLGLETTSSKTCLSDLLSKFRKSSENLFTLTEGEVNRFRFRVGLAELTDKQLINCISIDKHRVITLNLKNLKRKGLIK